LAEWSALRGRDDLGHGRHADSAFNWYNQNTADNLVVAQSWTCYDPLIAIPRLVEQFARRDPRLTFFASRTRN